MRIEKQSIERREYKIYVIQPNNLYSHKESLNGYIFTIISIH